MRKKIEKLVEKKGFGNNEYFFPFKLFYAILEIAEVGEMWKKGKNKWQNGKWKNKTYQEWEIKIAEELIDVIFYILDASRLVCPNVNLDKVFEHKYVKNLTREYRYGIDKTYEKLLEILK
jgi:NTP pyrophosphatase (non-canonical NTP hydrolase)